MSEIFCTICARGGSKGVPNKNIRLLLGKPLIAHTVERALEAGLFACVAVSSDSDAILKAAEAAGATHLIVRPPELATDEAAKVPVIQHAMVEAEKAMDRRCDVLVDLDVTSPLRSVDDILAAYELLLQSGAENVITAMPARRSPYFNMVERDEAGWVHLAKSIKGGVARRQAAPPCFDMNASIYAWRREALMRAQSAVMERTALYVMPEERSLDVDTEFDFELIEFLASRLAGEGRKA